MGLSLKNQCASFVVVLLISTFSVSLLLYNKNNGQNVVHYMERIFINRSMLQSTLRKELVEDTARCHPTHPPRLLLLPNDTMLDTLDESKLLELYWRYINSIQVLCTNQTRFGSMDDGGKEICLDNLYKPRHPCLVYSFGSNFQFDFENSVIQHYQCEVHTFDPSQKLRGHVPHGISFHYTGISDKTYTNELKWSMSTVSDIRKSLKHENRTIDILKIDVEGAEWVALPQIVSSGVLQEVKQISIEIHFGRTKTNSAWGGVHPKEQLKVLRALHEAGFYIFMHEHNLSSKKTLSAKYPTITTVNEISLINVQWTESRNRR